MEIPNTTAGRIIQNVELDRLMTQLKEHLTIPVQLRQQRMAMLQDQTAFKRTTYQAAFDALKVEEARIFFEIDGATDEKGKPMYTNETARKHAMVQRCAADEAYKEALAAFRAAEAEADKIQLNLNELDEQIKVEAEVIWGLRELVRAAAVTVNAIATFDGPKLPMSIPITLPTDPLLIRLVAPESLPNIHLVDDGKAA